MAWSPVALDLFQKQYMQLPPIFVIRSENLSERKSDDRDNTHENNGTGMTRSVALEHAVEQMPDTHFIEDNATDIQRTPREMMGRDVSQPGDHNGRSPSTSAGSRRSPRFIHCPPRRPRARSASPDLCSTSKTDVNPTPAVSHPGPSTATIPSVIQHIEDQLRSVNADPDCILRAKQFASEIGPAAVTLGETLSSTDLEDLEFALRRMQRSKALGASKDALERETRAVERRNRRHEMQLQRERDAELGVDTVTGDWAEIERLIDIDDPQWRQKQLVFGKVAAAVGMEMVKQVEKVRIHVRARDMAAEQTGDGKPVPPVSASSSTSKEEPAPARRSKRTAVRMLAKTLSIKRTISQPPSEPRLRLCHVRMYQTLLQLFKFPQVTSPNDMSRDTIELLFHIMSMLGEPWQSVWRKPAPCAALSRGGQTVSNIDDDDVESSLEHELSSDSEEDSDGDGESETDEKSELRCICYRAKGLNITSFCKRVYQRNQRRSRKEATQAMRSHEKRPSSLREEVKIGKSHCSSHCAIL